MPDLLALTAVYPEEFPYLLDTSAAGSGARGHSLLLFAAAEALVQYPGGRLEGPGEGNDFFARLEQWYDRDRVASDSPGPARDHPVADAPPFAGGWFLFLGYEMAGQVERRLELPPNNTGLPDAIAARCPGAIIVVRERAASGESTVRAMISAESAEVLERIRERIDARPGIVPGQVPELASLHAEPPEKFRTAVTRVLAYLRAGDIFQANISRRWHGRFSAEVSAASIYQRLRTSNPAPFAGMMHWQGKTLLSSSPERLVQIRGTVMQTRPIAGTRSRGADPAHDLELSAELIDNVKERAEHVMLIDLERNDMGRVCRPGSIEVNELMVIESYAHVHHIVSNIRGELAPGASPVAAIRAVFPGGTITGCPKVRCMEIIAELEQEGRGFYTGSMGYLGTDGSLDLNILIRTMMLNGRDVTFRTGAGIVADSLPERELEETREKARGMLLALKPDGAERDDV